MQPDPFQPQKPPATPPARRVSDAASGSARQAAGGPTLPAGPQLPAPALSPLGSSLPEAHRLAPLAAPWAAVVLGGSTAAVAAGAALLFTHGLGWSAAAGAVGAALCAVGAAAVPAMALVRRQAPAAVAEGKAGTASPRGVCSRGTFLDLVEREWSRARRYGMGAALLLIDIDRHARLVDHHGAGAPDAVLDELARQTAPTLRGADAIARFGPTQLAVFLVHADATGALDVAERIRERAERLQLQPEAEPLRVTVSLGVAQLRPAHLHMQALVHDAEDAVFAARQAGGNCVRSAPVDAGSRPAGWRQDSQPRPL